MTSDPTFEGVHPLDHGHALVAAALEPVIRSALGMPAGWTGTTLEGRRGVAEVDRALYRSPYRSAVHSGADIKYVNGVNLTIRGRAFNDTPGPYNRLPSAAKVSEFHCCLFVYQGKSTCRRMFGPKYGASPCNQLELWWPSRPTLRTLHFIALSC